MTVTIDQKAAPIHAVFGLLTAAAAAGLIRGHLGAVTTPGRVTVDLLVGTTLLAIITGWNHLIRHPLHLEVASDVITLVGRDGSRSSQLHRLDGELYLLVTGSAKARSLSLCATASTTRLALPHFDRREVFAACSQMSWLWADNGA